MPPLTSKQLYRNVLATSPMWVYIGYLFTTTYAIEKPLPLLPTLGLLALAVAASYGIFRDMRERDRAQ